MTGADLKVSLTLDELTILTPNASVLYGFHKCVMVRGKYVKSEY